MDKLTKLLIAILIGLNLSGCDPEKTFQDHLYQRTFMNDSDEEITLIYHRLGSSETDEGDTMVKDILTLPAHIPLVRLTRIIHHKNCSTYI